MVLDPLPGPTRSPLAGDTLRVLTWNVHYGAGGEKRMGRTGDRDAHAGRLAAIGAQIRAWDVDVVALQEVDRLSWRSHDIDGLELIRAASGLPYAAWGTTWRARWVPWPTWDPNRHIGRIWSGQAILSRLPLLAAKTHPLVQSSRGRIINRFALHRALLEVEVALGEGRSLHVLGAHLEAFDQATRARHVTATAAVAQGLAPDALLLGDLNSDDPGVLLPLSSVGLLRAAITPEETPPDPDPWATWPAAHPERRLDQVWFGARLQRLSVTAPRPDAGAAISDHLPLLVDLAVLP